MTDTNKTPAAAAAEAIAKAAAGTVGRPEAPGVVKRTSSYTIDPKAVTRRVLDNGKKFNPRVMFGDIDSLAASIKTNGMANPIRVKRLTTPTAEGHVFELIDGDRRLTAIELLMKKGETFPAGIPAIIVDKTQDDVTSLVQMFASNDGLPFTPIEESEAYGRMKDAGMTIAQICKAVGRRQVHVVEILALTNADQSVKDAVASGKIGKTMAKKIATHARGDKAKQVELTQAAIAAGSDKTKRRAVIRQVDDARRTKAAKKGQTLKMRALSDDELSTLGQKMAGILMKKLGEAKVLDHKDDLEGWISKDDKLAAAFTVGVLQGLKAAAGVKCKLDL